VGCCCLCCTERGTTVVEWSTLLQSLVALQVLLLLHVLKLLSVCEAENLLVNALSWS
jgi:hypothetical protein